MATANPFVTWQDDLYGVKQWTYGNWGGRGWSGGVFTRTTDRINRAIPALNNDPLDQAFKNHDIGYEDAMLKWNASAKQWETHGHFERNRRC